MSLNQDGEKESGSANAMTRLYKNLQTGEVISDYAAFLDWIEAGIECAEYQIETVHNRKEIEI